MSGQHCSSLVHSGHVSTLFGLPFRPHKQRLKISVGHTQLLSTDLYGSEQQLPKDMGHVPVLSLIVI